MNKMIKKPFQKKQLPMLVAAICIYIAGPALALPVDDSNMTVTNGSATYSYDGTAQQGTLTFGLDNSMVSFAVDAVNITQDEILNVVPTAGGSDAWVGVIRDDSGMQSQLNGTLAAGMRVFFLNSNGIITGNNFSVDFSGLTNTAGGLVLSTHSLNQNAFGQGDYQLESSSNGASIQLDGLQVNGQGAQVLVLADQLAINGAVNVPAGQFHGVSAGEVDVTFGVGDLIVVKGAVPVAQAGIDASSAANISAGHVNLEAWVSDPLSLALNNQGMVSATGISINDKGSISLIGRGGNVLNSGTLNANDAVNGAGTITLQGNIVALGGALEADTLQIEVGDAQGGTDGELIVLDGVSVNASTAVVNGVGDINTISGLANYHVEAQNAGSAGWQGVGGADWTNTGATSFNNISRLVARGDIDNTLAIEQAGSLVNGSGTALLRGGARNDTFNIAGSAQLLEGLGGSDLFVMQGGVVEGLVDGGGGIDSIENVFNVTRSGRRGINGSSDFVNWVNIQNVLELQVPDPVPLPNLNGVIAPQLSFANVSNITAASLGLVGAGAEPRLPCGFGSAPIAASTEEPCMEDFSGPEFQQLISSLIHFDNDSSAITPASAIRLNKVADFFVESQAFNKVVIAAHTDDNASEVYNLALSERRALSTSRYMQGRGVRSDLIETFNFGEVLPAVPNISAENRAYNRRARIELKR